MACVLVAVIALLLGNLHLGIGTDTEKEDITGEKSIAKQYVISDPFVDQRQPQNVPSNYQLRPQNISFFNQPQLQAVPIISQSRPQTIPFLNQPQPQFVPIISQPQPETSYQFVDRSYFYPPEVQSPRSSGSGNNLATFFAILLLSDQIDAAAATTEATTTTATTTPSPDDACTYGEWGTCSAVCKGTQSRDKTCNGVVQSESRDCNTQVGFLSDGWYRASNCYDYLLTQDEFNYAESQTACDDLGADLATVGMRDADVRREVVTALHASGQTVFVYIGLDRLDGAWDWLDGSTTVPNFWDVSEPHAAGDCAVLVSGNPESGHDANCDNNDYISYCEREAT